MPSEQTTKVLVDLLIGGLRGAEKELSELQIDEITREKMEYFSGELDCYKTMCSLIGSRFPK
jgi:hypothetical protein